MVAEIGQKHGLSHAYQLFHGDSSFAPGISYWGRDGQPITAYFRYRWQASAGGVAIAPRTKDPTFVMTSLVPSFAGSFAFNGSGVTGGVATFDVPRNIAIGIGNAVPSISASTTTFRFAGTDVYGVAMTEAILGPQGSLSPGLGLKAFKTVISPMVADRSTQNAITVGFDDTLGLPFMLEGAWDMIATFVDATASTTFTITAGVTTAATATTGDVRGTVKPSSACNGVRVFTVVMTAAGKDTKANLYGVTQA